PTRYSASRESMPNVVVLLTCDNNCNQAEKIAYAILGGYSGEVEVYAYNYRTRALLKFSRSNMRTASITVSNQGVLDPSKTYNTWRAACSYLGVDPGNPATTPIVEQQFKRFKALAKTDQEMTTLEVRAVDKYYGGKWIADAAQELRIVEQHLN